MSEASTPVTVRLWERDDVCGCVHLATIDGESGATCHDWWREDGPEPGGQVSRLRTGPRLPDQRDCGRVPGVGNADGSRSARRSSSSSP